MQALFLSACLALDNDPVLPRRQVIQVDPGSGSEEAWSYPVIALRDPHKHMIRLYGQYSIKVIG